MSRHTLDALSPRHEVVVGWDRPMGTFFAQVIDLEAVDEDLNMILWVGGMYQEITRAFAVIEAVMPYAAPPTGLLAVLEAEREATRLDPDAMCNTIRDWREDR